MLSTISSAVPRPVLGTQSLPQHPVPPGIPPRDPGDKPWEPDYTEPEPINEPVNEPIQWPEVEVKPQTTFAVGLWGALVGLAAAAWGIATQF